MIKDPSELWFTTNGAVRHRCSHLKNTVGWNTGIIYSPAIHKDPTFSMCDACGKKLSPQLAFYIKLRRFNLCSMDTK